MQQTPWEYYAGWLFCICKNLNDAISFEIPVGYVAANNMNEFPTLTEFRLNIVENRNA